MSIGSPGLRSEIFVFASSYFSGSFARVTPKCDVWKSRENLSQTFHLVILLGRSSDKGRAPRTLDPAFPRRVRQVVVDTGIKKLSVLPEPVPVATTTFRPATAFRVASS